MAKDGGRESFWMYFVYFMLLKRCHFVPNSCLFISFDSRENYINLSGYRGLLPETMMEIILLLNILSYESVQKTEMTINGKNTLQQAISDNVTSNSLDHSNFLNYSF